MKRLSFVFLFLSLLLANLHLNVFASGKSYSELEKLACRFCGAYETKALNFAKDNIELEVVKVSDLEKYPASFPVSTKLYGSLCEHRDARRISRDEIRKFHLTKAVLPSGKVESLDKFIKVRTVRKTETAYWATNSAFLVTGGVLALTADAITMALPIGRGGIALWGFGHYAYEARKGESRLREGAKGFVKGALMPIPFLVLKGDPLYIHPGSVIVLHGNKINASLIKKYNDIQLEAKYREGTDGKRSS